MSSFSFSTSGVWISLLIVGTDEDLEEINKGGAPLVNQDINRGGREPVALMESETTNANLKLH